MRNWFFLFIAALGLIWSCRTEIPFDPDPMEPDPADTTTNVPGDPVTNPGDTLAMTPGDTSVTDTVGQPCDTALVYFDTDILPILQGNCALSGCHDQASAQHELVLTSYSGLLAHDDLIVPYEPDESELFEKITEDNADKRMPPPPNAPLLRDQISLIEKWILQGAMNNSCDNSSTGNECDTSIVSFAGDIMPILNTNCVTCHSGSNLNGGVNLSNHAGVSQVARSGKLSGVVGWKTGFIMMPLGGNQLPECNVSTIDAWINQGAMNN